MAIKTLLERDRTTMALLSRPERLQIMLHAEELAAIDDWRFAKQMPSRAAAIRDLLRRGLAAEGVDLVDRARHSSSFGVLRENESAGERAQSKPIRGVALVRNR